MEQRRVKINRKNDLSLRLLEIFEAMMRCQTTVGAAEDLGISQPAVSNGIAALEKQLGFSLFERAGRQLRPTEDARLFLEEVQPLFSVLRNIETQARDLRSSKAGRLRISCTPPLGNSVLPEVLSRVLRARPAATSRYLVRRMDTVLQNVQMGISDIGFVLDLQTHLDLDITPLAEHSMVCVLPSDHPLAAKDSVTPEDLVQENLIGLETNLGAKVREAFAQCGFSFRARVEVHYCHTACTLVKQGLGITVVDPYSARFSNDGGLVIRPFLPDTRIIASAAMRRGGTLPRVACEFLDEGRDVLQTHPVVF